MKSTTTFILLWAVFTFLQAQHNNSELPVSIRSDGAQPNASAMLDVQSTTKGMLVPRMTSPQRTSIATPAQGLLVFDTNTESFWFYNGGWINLRSDGDQLRDNDGDTKVQVESNSDEDVIRFDLEGTEKMTLSRNTNGYTRLDFPNNNGQVFIGPEAGEDNTNNLINEANTFLGYSAGKNNTSGKKNTLIGGQAGSSLTTGNANTFIGEDAGLISNGEQNTYIGVNAGRNITTGSNNTYIGLGAGNSSPGNFNTFLGYAAGQSASGNNNLFLGVGAGSNNAGNANVFLGHNAGFNETGSDLLYVENSSSASPLIYGDFSSDELVFNGQVGIGTMPVSQLDVEGGLSVGAGYAGSSPAPVNGVIIEGYVGIGTTNPDRPLSVHTSSGTSYIRISDNTSGPSSGLRMGMSGSGDAYIINDENTKNLSLGTNGTTQMRIDDSGQVGINELYPDQTLHIKQMTTNTGLRIEHQSVSDYWENGIGTNTHNYKFYYNTSLRADISSVDGAYTPYSDRRLKRNIQPLGNVLSKIGKLEPSTYQFKDSPARSPNSIGFIAQDVEKIFPDLVREGDEGYLGLVYDGFAVIAIKAIQEQQKLIEQLQERIEHLESGE